jgi:hypothetical protein
MAGKVELTTPPQDIGPSSTPTAEPSTWSDILVLHCVDGGSPERRRGGLTGGANVMPCLWLSANRVLDAGKTEKVCIRSWTQLLLRAKSYEEVHWTASLGRISQAVHPASDHCKSQTAQTE